MIQLGQSPDGRLILGTNETFSSDVKYIEYYAEQRLFSLIFEDDESRLMPCEINESTTPLIQNCGHMVVLEMTGDDKEPLGYIVPVIQVGS